MAAGSAASWESNLTPSEGRGKRWTPSTETVKHFSSGLSPQGRNGPVVMWAVGCGSHRCRCRPAVPSWVLTGRDPPPWPQRYPAAHLSDSALWLPSSCSWCRWEQCGHPRGTRSRCTETVWNSVSGLTAPELGYGALSLPSRSTWPWQVSSCCRQVT